MLDALDFGGVRPFEPGSDLSHRLRRVRVNAGPPSAPAEMRHAAPAWMCIERRGLQCCLDLGLGCGHGQIPLQIRIGSIDCNIPARVFIGHCGDARQRLRSHQTAANTMVNVSTEAMTKAAGPRRAPSTRAAAPAPRAAAW